ncbi:hypothetical protein [Paenibacillus flagellatus]|uniref:Uncharacterized protein n=1 Tax=Paenibacillus flagellatus TaxID=2211139 RepID=A0A2V5JZV4_9BACL|nr:hypothetical protein [Paenibacillus flagellatus]PYI52495.1 hypothetical protein DLM86_20160 [Paenibacillus flagellatus]
MAVPYTEQELITFVTGRTGLDAAAVRLVLKHAQTYIDQANARSKGEAEIDGDELTDYVLGRPDVKLNELQVEAILEAEMEFLIDKGVAGYDD